MKYILTLFATLFIGLFSQLPAHATWAYVQNKIGNGGGGGPSSVTQTFNSSVAVGDLVIVATSNYNNLTISSVSDTGGSSSNTWIPVASASNTAAYTFLYYSIIAYGGTLSVTVQYSGSGYPALDIIEYSATPGTITVASSNTGTGAAFTTPAAGNVTFTANKALIVGVQSASTTPPGAGTGFTIRGSIASSGNNLGTSAEDDLNATSSPVNVVWGATLGQTWSAVGAAFQSSGDSSTPPAPNTASLLLQ